MVAALLSLFGEVHVYMYTRGSQLQKTNQNTQRHTTRLLDMLAEPNQERSCGRLAAIDVRRCSDMHSILTTSTPHEMISAARQQQDHSTTGINSY